MTRSFTGAQNFPEIQRPPAFSEAWRSGGPLIAEREAPTPSAGHFQDTVDANIVITGGPDDGYIVPISSRGLTIGRLPDNDVIINEPWVSRKHAEILRVGSQHILRDLSSSNGTFISDRQIGGANHPLQDGDQIRFGRSTVQLIFRLSGAVTLKMGIKKILRDDRQTSRPPALPTDAAQNTLASLDAVPSSQRPGSAPDYAGEELFEGDVRLNVSAGGDLRIMFQFVHDLRQDSRLRVLRLVRGAHQDIAVWLALREQVALKRLLTEMKCVSEVDSSHDVGSATERTFDIALSA